MQPRLERIYRLIMPPLMVKLIERLGEWFFFRRPSTHTCDYFPHPWDRFPSRKSEGWSSPGGLDAEVARWKDYCGNLKGTGPFGFSHEHADLSLTENPFFHNVNITFAYVLALTARKSPQPSVLDYGGALGHYCQLGAAAIPDLRVEYHVRELPAMARIGRDLNPRVIWHEDDACLSRSYDLVMVSSSLQYVRDWKELLAGLSGASRHYFFLTRIGVVDEHPTFLSVQQVYDSRSLCWTFNRQELVGQVQSSGLKLMREMVVGDPVVVRGISERPILRGWLFVRPPGP